MGVFKRMSSEFRFTLMERNFVVRTMEKDCRYFSKMFLLEDVDGVEKRLYDQYCNCVDVYFSSAVNIDPLEPDYEARRAMWFANYALNCVEKGELVGLDACLTQ